MRLHDVLQRLHRDEGELRYGGLQDGPDGGGHGRGIAAGPEEERDVPGVRAGGLERQVVEGLLLLPGAVADPVFHDADDLGAAGGARHHQALPQWIPVAEEPAGHDLPDHRHRRLLPTVLVGEPAAAKDREAHGLEEVGGDPLDVGAAAREPRQRVHPRHPEAGRHAPPERLSISERGGLDPRVRPRRLHHRVEGAPGSGTVEAGPGGIDVHHEDARGVIPDIDGQHVAQAADEEPRPDHQHHAERDLGHDQPRPEPRAPEAAAAAPFLEHRREVGTGDLQRGDETRDERGHERRPERDREDPAIGGEPLRQRRRQHVPPQGAATPDRDQHAEGPGEGRGHHPFEEELPHQPPLPRAERLADRQLPGPGQAPGQQQVGHVCAGDQEDHDRHRRQPPREGRPVRKVGPGGLQHRPELHFPESLTVGRVGTSSQDERCRLRFRLLGSDAGRQSRHDRDEVPAPIGAVSVPRPHLACDGRERHPEVRGRILAAVEARRGDPDDREHLIIERQAAPHDRGVRAEPGAPQPLAQHCGRHTRVGPIIRRPQQAPEQRRGAHQREVVSGRPRERYVHGLRAPAQRCAAKVLRRHRREPPGPPEVGEVGVAHHRIGVVAELRTREVEVRARHPLRCHHARRLPEQQRVQHAGQRGHRPDTERQGERGSDGEAPGAEHRAGGMRQVLPQGTHQVLLRSWM